VALANVVNQNTNIEPLDNLSHPFVIGVVILREVHSEGLDLDALSCVLGLDIGGERIELGGGARDEDEIEPLASEL
jgi:hypothetical protein